MFRRPMPLPRTRSRKWTRGSRRCAMSFSLPDLPVRDQADIELLRALVAIPSLSYQERDAVYYLRNAMRSRGFELLDSAAGSAIGRIGSGDTHIVLLGHIDTVSGHIP